jgi:hypothetical protein
MPISEEGRLKQIEALKKAREIRQENIKASHDAIDSTPVVTEPAKEVQVTVPAPTQPSTVTTVTPSHDNTPETTLVSLDESRMLNVCIADVCWEGNEITITHDQFRHLSEHTPNMKYQDLVTEVYRVLKDGGYKPVDKKLL